MRKVLATDLSIWPGLESLHVVSDALLARRETRARIANYLLLYDQIIIPTANFLILPVLRQILGEGVFDQLVQNKIIVFVRYSEWFCYIGGGGGLGLIKVEMPNKGANLAHALFSSTEQSIDLALRNTLPKSGVHRSRILKNLLLDNLVEVDISTTFQELKTETYQDINESPYLRNLYDFDRRGGSLNSLRGIKKNQVRVCAPHSEDENKSKEIWTLLNIAFENFILNLSSQVGVDEITGDNSSLNLLKAKGSRVGMPIEGINAFTQIQSYSEIPDIGSSFSKKLISPETILEIRQTENAKIFRNWLSQSKPNERKDEILGRYIDDISKLSTIDKLPSKIFRFVSTCIASAGGELSGTAASFADSFLVNKWFPKKTPKLFMQDLKTLSLQNTKAIIPNPKDIQF